MGWTGCPSGSGPQSGRTCAWRPRLRHGPLVARRWNGSRQSYARQATKRLTNVNNTVCLVYKIVQRLAQRWRKITGSNLCGLVLAGVSFEDGQMAQSLAA